MNKEQMNFEGANESTDLRELNKVTENGVKLPQAKELHSSINELGRVEVSFENLANDIWHIIEHNYAKKQRDLKKEDVVKFLLTLMAMNTHHKGMKFIFEEESAWSVPTIFSNLIFPEDVVLVDLPDQPNLIQSSPLEYVTEEQKDSHTAMLLSEYDSFMAMLAKHAGQKKLSMNPLSNLRRRKSLSDILLNIVEDGNVAWTFDDHNKPFYFLVNNTLRLQSPKYLNTNIYEYVISEFRHNWNLMVRGAQTSDK